MDRETQAEMDRLEREIWSEDKDLSDILADDVLKELEDLLGQQDEEEEVQPYMEAFVHPNAKAAPAPRIQDDYEEEEEYEYHHYRHEDHAESNDKLIVGLLIAANALCVSLIGIMIYWLETLL